MKGAPEHEPGVAGNYPSLCRKRQAGKHVQSSIFSHFLCVKTRVQLQGIHCPGKFLSERGKAEVMHSGWASEGDDPCQNDGFSLATAMQERRECLNIPKTQSIFGVANSGYCAHSGFGA